MDHMAPTGFSRGERKPGPPTTFEDTYPRYEFSELVRLGLAGGGWLVRQLRHIEREGLGLFRKPLPDETKPAE